MTERTESGTPDPRPARDLPAASLRAAPREPAGTGDNPNSDAPPHRGTPSEPPAKAVIIRPGVWIDPGALAFTFVRASGPGGQAVNKISSAAQARLPLSGIHGLDEPALNRLRKLAGRRLTTADELIIESQEHRGQRANRDECTRRIVDLISRAWVRPVVRRKKKPTRSMIEKRLDKKRQQSEKKRRRGRPGMD